MKMLSESQLEGFGIVITKHRLFGRLVKSYYYNSMKLEFPNIRGITAKGLLRLIFELGRKSLSRDIRGIIGM